MIKIDYMRAIKRPFKSPLKLFLSALLFLIPIVNFIVIGYFLEAARTAYKKNYEMPGYKGHFKRGLLAFVISFILMLPLYVYGHYSFYLSVLYIPSLILLALTYLIMILLAAIVAYLVPLALTNYAIKGEFIKSFHGLKKAFTKTYFKAYLISMFYTLVLYIIAAIAVYGLFVIDMPIEIYGMLTLYIISLLFFLSKITLFTILGEIYREL